MSKQVRERKSNGWVKTVIQSASLMIWMHRACEVIRHPKFYRQQVTVEPSDIVSDRKAVPSQLRLWNAPFHKYGYIEVGRTLKETHYKFAGELVIEMLVAGVPESQQQAEAVRHFRTIANLLPVFALTDVILTMYVDARRLVD